MRTLFITAVALIVCGCAAQDETPSASALLSASDEEPKMICTREKPTGSNRLRKVCRPAGDAIDEENTRRDMQILQRQSEIINAPPD